MQQMRFWQRRSHLSTKSRISQNGSVRTSRRLLEGSASIIASDPNFCTQVPVSADPVFQRIREHSSKLHKTTRHQCGSSKRLSPSTKIASERWLEKLHPHSTERFETRISAFLDLRLSQILMTCESRRRSR